MKDGYERHIDYLRISLTDRCQLRCTYCLPATNVKWLPKEQLMTRQEVIAIVETFARLGVTKIKLTGGEPLLYPDLPALIKQIKAIPTIEQVTLTTNGVKLAEMAASLAAAGLDGINISLDTLDRKKYEQITRRDRLNDVLKGIETASVLLPKVKINCVITKHIKEYEAIALLAKERPIHVRFIEMMPIGGQVSEDYVKEADVRHYLQQQFGLFEPVREKLGNGPAHYYNVPFFTGKIGFISAISNHFCASCNRVRITSDGLLKTCLYFKGGINLKEALAKGNLEEMIKQALAVKPKAHLFNEKNDSQDGRFMAQIGG